MTHTLFLIATNIKNLNTGRGGHYYTVLDQYNAFKKSGFDVFIVCIGHAIPAPFKAPGITIIFIKCSCITEEITAIRNLKSAASSKKNVIFHAFDSNAFLFARIAGAFNSTPTLYTKCGGAIRTGYTPSLHPDIVFHRQDYEYYLKKGGPLENRHLEIIPNRVAEEDFKENNTLPPQIFTSPKKEIKIIRIARICEKYKESIIQTINLARNLNENGLPAFAAVVGYPEDEATVSEVKRYIEGVGIVITNEDLTTNAKRHLQEADIVVASGRGVMESALSGKITMLAVAGCDTPELVDLSNIENGLYYNFSERYISKSQPGDSLFKLIKLLESDNNSKAYRENISEFAKNNFSICSAIEKYRYIYNKTTPSRSIYSKKDIAVHIYKYQLGKALRLFPSLPLSLKKTAAYFAKRLK